MADLPAISVNKQVLSAVLGDIVATQVSLADYLEQYAAEHCEWIEGIVIKMAPAELKHNNLIYYLYQLISAYFELNPIGVVVGQPFVMHLPAVPGRGREPDLLVVLKSNAHPLTDTLLAGPADLVIEVVSQESIRRDHGEKFSEYEQGGVGEYWIIDYLRREARFYRRGDDGRYQRQTEDHAGHYRTSVLPGLVLHVPTLWQETLPGPIATARAVQAMLGPLE